MLRRYSAHGVETRALRIPATLIGSGDVCDIVISNCDEVEEKHALIVFHPVTNSFWFRQIGRKTTKKKNDSKGVVLSQTFIPTATTIIPAIALADSPFNNEIQKRERVFKSLHYGAMVELHAADTLRFGSGEQSVDYVFEMSNAIELPKESQARPLQSSSTTSTASSIVVDRKRHVRKHRDGTNPYRSNSLSLDKNYAENISQDLTLPIVGNKIRPKRFSDRWTRSDQPTTNHRMCKMMSLPHVKQRETNILENRDVDEDDQPPLPQMQRAFSTPKGSRQEENTVPETQLLQRIVRLQAEMQRKDAEIAMLRREAKSNRDSKLLSKEMFFQEQSAREVIKEQNDTSEKDIVKNLMLPDFAQLIDNTFFAVCRKELEAINQKVSNASIRDYGDVFTETAKALQEPFSFRLMEINTKCSAIFEHSAISQTDREQLYVQFDRFLKEKIYPISKAFDSILPVLKDAAMMARESVRACSVFSQWSREFGDQLQLQPNWELMSYKVDDLQTRFREFSMPKHWLPPSLTPLLRIIIYEYKNRFEEYIRKGYFMPKILDFYLASDSEAVLMEKLVSIKTTLAQLNSQLSPADQAIIKEIMEDETVNNEEDISRENQRLRNVIMQLEHKISTSSNPPSRDHSGGRAFIVGAVHRIPSHSSMQRDFVGSIEENRPFTHTTNFSRGHSLDTPLTDYVYRNSSTNGSSAKTVPENAKNDDSPSKSVQVLEQPSDDCSRRKRSIDFTPPSHNNILPTESTSKPDSDRQSHSTEKLSECSIRTTVEDSEQTQSDIASTVNSIVDNDDEKDEITPANSLTALDHVNELYNELREQRKMSQVKSTAENDERENSVCTPASRRLYHDNAGATPFSRTPLADESESEQADDINPQNSAAVLNVQITVNDESYESSEGNIKMEDTLKAEDANDTNKNEMVSDAEEKNKIISDILDAEVNTMEKDIENVSPVESCPSHKQKLHEIEDFEQGAEQILERPLSGDSIKNTSGKASTEPSQIQTPELCTEPVGEAILINRDASFDDIVSIDIDAIRNIGNSNPDHDDPIVDEVRRDSETPKVYDDEMQSGTITPLDKQSNMEAEEKVEAEKTLNLNENENAINHNLEDGNATCEHVDELKEEGIEQESPNSMHGGSSIDLDRPINRLESAQSEESLPFRYERTLYHNDERTDSGELSDARKDSGALSELKRNLVDDAIHNAIDRVTPLAGQKSEILQTTDKVMDNDEQQESDIEEGNLSKRSIISEGTVEFNESNQEYEDTDEFFNQPSSSRLRKISKESTIPEEEKDINEVATETYAKNISTAQASVDSPRRKATEFWELATVLAQLLNVDLITLNRSNTSPTQSTIVIDKSLRSYRSSSWPSQSTKSCQTVSPLTADELAARQLAADTILQKINSLLTGLDTNH